MTELLGVHHVGVTHSGVIDTPRGGILNFKDPDSLALALFWDG